jgi:hypothetical protein
VLISSSLQSGLGAMAQEHNRTRSIIVHYDSRVYNQRERFS